MTLNVLYGFIMDYFNDVIMLHIVINKSVESIITEWATNLLHNIKHGWLLGKSQPSMVCDFSLALAIRFNE